MDDGSVILLIAPAGIPISSQTDARKPGRGLPHDGADVLQVFICGALDDQLIVDMTDDTVIPEVLHGIAEDIAADRLHDVLNEFRTVGFDAAPFLCGIRAIVGDGFGAVLVESHLGLHIGEPSAGWEFDKKHSGFPDKLHSSDF